MRAAICNGASFFFADYLKLGNRDHSETARPRFAVYRPASSLRYQPPS